MSPGTAHMFMAQSLIYDKNFITKRADRISNITKEFDDIPHQRVDLILRNLNDDTDYLSAEENRR